MNCTTAYAQWRKDNTGWWFSEGNSWSTGWRLIANNWYFFESNGYMKTGWLLDNGIWYYLHSSGEMACDNVLIDGKYSTFDASGKWTGYLNTTDNGSNKQSSTLLFIKFPSPCLESIKPSILKAFNASLTEVRLT